MAGERYCGIAKQAALKTLVAASDWLDLVNFNIKEEQGFIVPETIRGYDPFHALLGSFKCSGSLEGYLCNETVGLILLSILGQSTPVGAADPYTHTFLSNKAGVPLSLYLGDLIVAGESKVTGANINKLELAMAAKEVVTFKADFFGHKSEQSALQAPVFDVQDPLIFHQCDVSQGGASIKALVEACKFSIERAVADDEYTLGSRFIEYAFQGAIKAKTELDIYFESLVEWKRFYDGAVGVTPGSTYTPFSQILSMTYGASDSLVITCPKTVYNIRDAKVDKRSRTMEKVEALHYFDATQTSAIKAELKNAIAVL